jgi:hypothetical protein
LIRASPETSLNAFSKTLGLATVALCVAMFLLATLWPASWAPLHAGFAASGILLMAFNAFVAIGILRLRTGMEPVQLIMLSMLVRLGLIAAVMLAVIQFVAHGPALYSFVFSALGGYVIFQIVEIRHIIRNPGLLAK